jgi:hypothetical protein
MHIQRIVIYEACEMGSALGRLSLIANLNPIFEFVVLLGRRVAILGRLLIVCTRLRNVQNIASR